ncbi:unnamed protein product [Paramecium pentaurelia]|uniref:Uncharacterized protein n=1 Tax=Paramecium pentaurelia TaxID=43138 RepID=A0A8S1VT59_9CILI|nr:unnamed protein product [Paramecium pentaurelia]
MQNPLNQEQFILIEKINGELCIGTQQPVIQNIIVSCYQCQKKNQCSARAQFMKCGYCSQVNKVFDPDPLFYIDVYCQNCSKRIKIPKNGSVYRCPFCLAQNRKTNR